MVFHITFHLPSTLKQFCFTVFDPGVKQNTLEVGSPFNLRICKSVYDPSTITYTAYTAVLILKEFINSFSINFSIIQFTLGNFIVQKDNICSKSQQNQLPILHKLEGCSILQVYTHTTQQLLHDMDLCNVMHK